MHSTNNNSLDDNDNSKRTKKVLSSNSGHGKGGQYQLPGGKVGVAEFTKFKMSENWAEQRYLAGRSSCVRQVRQQTGLNTINASRFWPLIIHDPDQDRQKRRLKQHQNDPILNEYKQRLFYIVSVNDDDFNKQVCTVRCVFFVIFFVFLSCHKSQQ